MLATQLTAGGAEPALERAARPADGWCPRFRSGPDEEARTTLDHVRELVRRSGRDPSAFGIDGTRLIGRGSPAKWIELARRWRDVGATHLTCSTFNAGFESPQQHIDRIRDFYAAVG